MEPAHPVGKTRTPHVSLMTGKSWKRWLFNAYNYIFLEACQHVGVSEKLLLLCGIARLSVLIELHFYPYLIHFIELNWFISSVFMTLFVNKDRYVLASICLLINVTLLKSLSISIDYRYGPFILLVKCHTLSRQLLPPTYLIRLWIAALFVCLRHY